MRAHCLSLLWLGLAFSSLSGTRIAAEDAQWDFNGDLESTTGQAPLVPLAALPATDPEVAFESVSIGGQDAEVAFFSRGTYFDVPHGLPPNGGGAYVNQYTLILDVMFPDRTPSGSLTSLLQTNCCNGNDGDWFIGPDGGLGALGTFGGAVADGEWHRLALVVDLTVGTLTSYVDGVQVQQDTGEALDGRFSLYSPDDGDPEAYATFFIFADDSEQNSEGYVNSVQFHDLPLSPGVIAEIGGPTAAGIPRDVCIFPPAVATRDVVTTRTPEETNGDFLPGDVLDVEITISDIRVASGTCTTPAGIVVAETLPAGWTPSQISDAGVHDAGQNRITWTVTGPALVTGKKLTYKATAAATAELAAVFAGTLAENVPGAKASPVQGDSRLLSDVPFDACGGIRCWNILGAYQQPFGDSPGDDNLRLDYLTDGDYFESSFVFFPGAQVATAFGGDGLSTAISTGIVGGANGRNASGVPTVLAWNDRDSYVNLNDDVYGGNPDGVMAYAQAYVVNSTPEAVDVHLGISSDDSVQVLLNGQEVWYRTVGRAGSDACSPQDVSPDGFNFTAPHTLEPGENSLLVKVWEGGGGWNFAVRFQDEAGVPITSGLEVRKFPTGICTVPPVRVTRSISTQETVLVECVERPLWEAGAPYDVTLAVASVRGAAGQCAAPGSVTIQETVPAGWTPSNASNGGQIVGQTVTWTLTGAAIAAGSFTYRVQAPASEGDANFLGRITEPGSPVAFGIEGVNLLANPPDFSDQGFIRNWLLLGPYQQPTLGGGPAPAASAMRRDYLTDGAGITEPAVTPRHGDTVNTDFRGAARSIGLAPSPGGAPINPNGVPTWKAWRDLDDTINFANYYGGDVNQIVMYAVTYLRVAEDKEVTLGLASDDAVQVLLDGTEEYINSIARGFDGANVVQDVAPGVVLPAGTHRLMVKVFEGVGDHGFRLRLQDSATGEPVTDGVEICLDPECADREPPAVVFHRGDADDNNELQLTDAIRILGYLFLGSNAPGCLEAADADNNGNLELTDAVRILGFLFLGSQPPAPPGPPPAACGEDPQGTGDLGCESYQSC